MLQGSLPATSTRFDVRSEDERQRSKPPAPYGAKNGDEERSWRGKLLMRLAATGGAVRRVLGLRIRLDVVEVRIVEAGGVFKAEAEHTVEADVADPDGGDGKQNGFGSEEANRDERRWSEIGVAEVVAGGSDADADEIAEHDKIGCKEEHGEEEPTGVEVAVEENGRKKNESAFDLKQEFGSGHIGSVTLSRR